MKKLIALSITLITLFSCSKEEILDTDSLGNSNDPIIGLWKLNGHITETLTECKKKSTFEFLSNGLVNINRFNFITQNNTCDSITLQRLWKNRSQNNTLYSIFEKNENETEKDGQLNITFSDDNNVFTTKEGEVWTRQTEITTSPTAQNPILGTWYKFSFNDNEVSNCEKESTVQFKKDFSYQDTPYVIDNDKCIIDGERSGTWQYNNNGTYSFNGKVTPIKFADNNKTLIVGEGTNEKLIYKREKIINPEPIEKDPLIGEWYPFSEKGVEENNCRKQSTFTFSEDGKRVSKGINEDPQNEGKCIFDFEFTGTWERVSEGKYKFKDDNGEEGELEIIFNDNNNTMTILDSVYKRK